MSKFLINANLLRRLRFWQEDDCEFVPDTQWPDHVIWQYAEERQFTIVTKDAGFEKLARAVGPPVVIHLRAGRRSRKELWKLLA